MALHARSPAKHNEMLGRFLQQKSSNQEHDGAEQRPAKRRKRATVEDDGQSEYAGKAAQLWPENTPRETPDPDVDSDDEVFDGPGSTQRTDLESALPSIKTDKEAIEEYEAQRAAGDAELGLESRMERAEWVRGRTSIYVDAFNLALNTVLEEESHLFDAAETKVFDDWKALSYEAQYL